MWSIRDSLPPVVRLVNLPPGIMNARPVMKLLPGIWVIPAGLKAIAEGSSARPTMAPPSALPLALKS